MGKEINANMVMYKYMRIKDTLAIPVQNTKSFNHKFDLL